MTKTIFVPAYRALMSELRQARQRVGLTQAAAGRKVGRNRQFIIKIETCEVRTDVVQLCKLAKIYGLKAHELVHRIEEELSDEDGSFYVSTMRQQITLYSLWIARGSACMHLATRWRDSAVQSGT